MVSFLRAQPQLEILDIKDLLELNIFFEAARVSSFPFSLVKLYIRNKYSFSEMFSFLQSQRKSLQLLSLTDFNLSEENLQEINTLGLQQLESIDVEFVDFTKFLRTKQYESKIVDGKNILCETSQNITEV